jgi:Ca-activated chloride channel family protein
VILLIDISNSMGGDKIKNAVTAASSFLKRLDPDDEVYVISFADHPQLLNQGGRAGDVAEELGKSVSDLYADGSTSLYDAICEAAGKVNTVRSGHDASGDKRLYGIVVLSDGMDTASHKSQNDMFNCLPSGEDVAGVKVFTIAYGEDADKDLMKQIANHTNGKTFAGDPDTIDKVYQAISAEQ